MDLDKSFFLGYSICSLLLAETGAVDEDSGIPKSPRTGSH